MNPGRGRTSGPGRAAFLLTAGVLAAGLLAGCSSGVESLSFPSPPPVPGGGAPPPTSAPGLAAAENPVGGVTTTTAPVIGPGPATINGTVLGPAGPVGGAVVEADRLVGDSVATARTTTAPDGSWAFRSVLGGRYRVRAWKSPSLDLTTPQILFLDASQPQSITLTLTAYPGPQMSVATNPAAPVQYQPVSLAVQVLDPTVNADGVMADQPVPGAAVTLVDGPGWQVASPNPAVTDSRGQALFTVSCTTVGSDPLSAQTAGAAPVTLQVPSCGVPPPPFTLAPPGGTGSTGPTSTTICPNGGAPGTTSSTGNVNPTSTTSLAFGNC